MGKVELKLKMSYNLKRPKNLFSSDISEYTWKWRVKPAKPEEEMDYSPVEYDDHPNSVIECINGHLGAESQSEVSDKLANAKLEVGLDSGGA